MLYETDIHMDMLYTLLAPANMNNRIGYLTTFCTAVYITFSSLCGKLVIGIVA